MKDNKKLWIVVVLLFVYGLLVLLKLAESSGLVVLITYAVKKLLDMHEDAQAAINKTSIPIQEVPKT